MKQKTNPNNSDMLESFYQRARQGETEQKFIVEINGQQVPTMRYINQMFFAENRLVRMANTLAKIALVIAAIWIVLSIILFLINYGEVMA